MGKRISGGRLIPPNLRRPTGTVGSVPATNPSSEQVTEGPGENPFNHLDRAGRRDSGGQENAAVMGGRRSSSGAKKKWKTEQGENSGSSWQEAAIPVGRKPERQINTWSVPPGAGTG